MKKIITGVCMFLMAMSSYAQSNDCNKCAPIENDHTKIIRVPKSYAEKIPVRIDFAEGLYLSSPEQLSEDHINTRFGQKRFFGLYYRGDALVEIGDGAVKHSLSFDLDIAAADRKRLGFLTLIKNMWVFPIEKENCYADVTVLDNTVRVNGAINGNGTCEMKMDFIFDRSCEGSGQTLD